MRTRLAVVGNGMAGMRTLEELLKLAPHRYDITVFGAEPHGNYNRIMLSPVLAGEKQLADIMLNDEDWYATHNITLHKSTRITSLDPRAHKLTTQDGAIHAYDKLILATGSDPFILPVPGHKLPGVITFRDIQDVEHMLAASQTGRHAVVIGGGLLGLEAAYGLFKQGMQVTIVHLLDTLMERQLDKPAAALLKHSLEQRGLTVLLERQTEAILGENKVSGVHFQDGTAIPADLVVMAVGIRPNANLAREAGIACQRGVQVNDFLITSDPDIYAIGECVEHRGTTYGLVAPLFEQAKILAAYLAGQTSPGYQGSITATSLKVTGIEVFSVGDFTGDSACEVITMQDTRQGIYRKLLIRDERLIGAVLYGDITANAWYFDLIREQLSITVFRHILMFGPDFLATVPAGNSMAEAA